MHTVDLDSTLDDRLARALPQLRLPAALRRRVAEALEGEHVQLLAGDLTACGFGAYEGQLCLVTPTRVLLVTATNVQDPDSAFGLEEWDRQIGALPRFLPPRVP